MKKIYQYTIDGTFIREFPSGAAVEKELGFKRAGIQAVARGENIVNHGYRWSFIKYDQLLPLSSFDKFDTIEGEKWKTIDGFSHYLVSNKGRVRTTTYISSGNKNKVEYGRIYNQSTSSFGYKTVSIIGDNGRRCLIRVHRLVAKAFIPNPNNLPMINHKNRITNDNNVDNLEWCTAKYNVNYGDAVEIRRKLNQKGYVQMDSEGNVMNIFFGGINAQKATGDSRQWLASYCKGRNKSPRGFRWAYLDDFPKSKQKELISKFYQNEQM